MSPVCILLIVFGSLAAYGAMAGYVFLAWKRLYGQDSFDDMNGFMFAMFAPISVFAFMVISWADASERAQAKREAEAAERKRMEDELLKNEGIKT